MTPVEMDEALSLCHEMQVAQLEEVFAWTAQQFAERYGADWPNDPRCAAEFAEVKSALSQQYWAQVARLQAGTFDHRTVQ